MLLRPEKPGSWPVDEAVQEVAPLLVSTLASGLRRPFGPYWFVLPRGCGVGPGASLGRRSLGGSEREPDLQGSS
jgi:hypothetical protein